MSQQAIDICQKAAEYNRNAPFRKGNLIEPPDDIRLVVTGDLHGNRRNFEKILRFADLDKNPKTHILFQEIIHGGPTDAKGGDLSFELLFSAFEVQIQYPGRVHMILGNHDTACITDADVSKGGQEMNRCMKAGLKEKFGNDFGKVYASLQEALAALPLGIRTHNGLWMSHSLPGDRYVEEFDPKIFDRPLTIEDYERPNCVYTLTWGRRHSLDSVNRMAEKLGAELFVLGHQNQSEGWGNPDPRTLIIASEHNHGCLLDIELSRLYTINELIEGVRPIASIA